MIYKGLFQSFIVSAVEFRLLCYCKGIENIRTFDLGEKPDRRAVLMALHSLAENKFIKSEGSSFVLCESFSEIINTLKNSAVTAEIYTSDRSIGNCCLYSDENTVIVSKHTNAEKEMFRITLYYSSDVFELLDERGYIPDNTGITDICFEFDDRIKACEETAFEKFSCSGQLDSDSYIKLLVKFRSDERTGSIAVIKNGFMTYVCCPDAENVKRYAYSKELLKKEIEEIIP
ncbi:MAG: hypothetical protein ACI4I9_07950 [Porcipelethomonas sp.]